MCHFTSIAAQQNCNLFLKRISYHIFGPMAYYNRAPEAVVLNVAMGCMPPKRESVNVSGSCLPSYRCLYHVNIDLSNIGRHAKLPLRLPFEGHGIPRLFPKIGP